METKDKKDSTPIPLFKLDWKLHSDFSGMFLVSWREHEVTVGVRSYSGPGPDGHRVHFDFTYQGKQFHYGLLCDGTDRPCGRFPGSIESGPWWLEIKITPESLEVYERRVVTLGDYMDKLEQIFLSCGFEAVKDSPEERNKERRTLEVKMFPR